VQIRRQQTQESANIQSHKLRQRLQLYPLKAIVPHVHGGHPHCLCHHEQAWTEGHHHHQGQSVRHSSMRECFIVTRWALW
jgi:hypothetical protein